MTKNEESSRELIYRHLASRPLMAVGFDDLLKIAPSRPHTANPKRRLYGMREWLEARAERDNAFIILQNCSYAYKPRPPDEKGLIEELIRPVLADRLWWLLLEANAENGDLTRSIHDDDNATANAAWSGVWQKLLRFRNQPSATLLVDAGHTTEEVVRQLKVRHDKTIAPTMAREAKVASSKLSYRSLYPFHFVTNSIRIATTVCAWKGMPYVEATMLAGEIDAENESVSGLLTQNTLAASVTSAHIAIVGAAGYLPESDGGPAFLCKSPREAYLKQSFLRMADLRVVICDSHKFARRDGLRSFTTDIKVDLVVTDNGKWFERADSALLSCSIKELRLASISVYCAPLGPKPPSLKRSE